MNESEADEETKKEKERVWADVNERLKFVNEKGKVMCKYCSKPEAGFKVTSNTVSLQDVSYMTNADKDGKVNFLFEGTCNHPSQQKPFSPPPPCKTVISLGEWKDYADVHIDNDYALIVDSTIPCMISGEDLQITQSGQIAELTEIDFLKLEVVDMFWIDESLTYKLEHIVPGDTAYLYVKTENYYPGQLARVRIPECDRALYGKVDENGETLIKWTCPPII